jgi:hypothetical protein
MKKLILLFVFAIALTNVYGATTYTWAGASGGTWGTTTNWNPNGTPITGDSVVINTGSAMSIALGGAQVVKGITFMGGGTITFTSAATQTFAATHIKVDGNSVVFSADQVTISSSLTFNGGSSKITHTPTTAGKAFILGNGNAFTLSGNNATNCLDGNGQYNFNTLSGLTAYFNPSNVYYQLIINRGVLTLGTNFQTSRLSWGSAPTIATGLTLNGNTLTLSASGAGTCALSNSSNIQGIDASTTGSKVVISTTSASFLSAASGYRIFRDTYTIDNLEMNSSGNTFISGYPLTVKNLTLTAGTINNSTNNISIASGGTITRSASAAILQAPPVFTGAVNVSIGANTATAGCELLGSIGRVGTLTVNNSSTYTLNASTGITATPITSGGLGYATAPTATFSAPTSGTTATGTAVIANGSVVGVNLTSAGTGYTTAPTITIAAPATPAWTSKSYSVNNTVTNDGGKVYICTTAGASAGSGGPTGTGTGIVDNVAKWNYIGASASTATATATYNGTNSLTVDALTVSGTVIYPNNANPLTLNVNNDITINTGASFLCGTQGNTVTHLLNVAGNITNNGTFTPVTTAGTKVVDVTLNGPSANQNLCAATFNNLTINNTSGLTPAVTLAGDITANTVTLGNGSSATLNIGGISTIVLSATNMNVNNCAVTFNAGAVTVISNLTFSGASSKIIHNPATAGKAFTLGNGGGFTLTGSSVTNCFDGTTAAQYNFRTSSGLTAYFNPSVVYYQLIVQQGIVTLGTDVQVSRFSWGSAPTSNTGLTLNGKILTLSASAAGSCTLTANNVYTIGIDASIAGSKVVISTPSSSFLSATGRIFKDATTIDNLEMNSTGNIFIPSYPLTVKNLVLTAGKISTGSNALTVEADGSVTGASSTSYIYGNLKKLIAAGSTSKTFEIGDATIYAPVTLALTGTIAGSTGSIQASTAIGDHAQIATSAINAAKSVNRTWTITNPDALTGLTSYSPTFTFVAGDVDGSTNTNNFIVGKYASSAWTLPTVGTKASTSTQATGVSDFGDFGIGEATAVATPTISTTGTLSAVNTTYGTPSASPTSFSVSGANMTAGILVTPPSGYEVSLASGSGYGSTVTVGAAVTISSTPVYVRLLGTAAVASYSGNIVLSSASATSVNVATVSSTVSAKVLTITADNQSVASGTAATIITVAGTYKSTGFENGEGSGEISGLVTYSTTYTNETAAGASGVTISPIVTGLSATNYSFNAVAGTITITTPTSNTVNIAAPGNTDLSAETTDISTDLTVSSTGTLTVDVSPKVNSLTVDAGGKVEVTTSNQLIVNDLTLKAGFAGNLYDGFSTSSVKVGGSGIKVNGRLKYVRTFDDTQWYFVSFPYDVTISEITSNAASFVLGNDWYIKYYDGAQRATGVASNWKHITEAATEADRTILHAKRGYIIGIASGTPTLTFPMISNTTIAAEADKTIDVTYYGSGTAVAEVHKGWNLIGQPFLSKFNAGGVGATNIPYMVFSDGGNVRTYTTKQPSEVTNLNPFVSYFVQVDATIATNKASFATNGRQLARSVVEPELSDRVRIYFNTATGSDNTNLLMDNNQTTAYQIGQDLEKWIGTGTPKPQIYTSLNGVNYAFNGLPMSNVVNLPLGIYTQTAGSTTIHADAALAPSLSKLLLIDNSTNPATVTDLLMSDYTFTAAAGTNNSRFAITAQRVPTSSVVDANANENAPQLSIVNCQLSIENLDGKASVRVFDAIGRMITNKTVSNNSLEIKLAAKGIYTVQIEAGGKNWVKKIVN